MIPGYTGTTFLIPVKLCMMYLWMAKKEIELLNDGGYKYSCLLTPGLESRPESTLINMGRNDNDRLIHFSSSQRSGSIVVSALTSVDLPWSTCPAVAMTYIYSACSCARRIAAASFSSSLAGMQRISIKHWPLCTRGNTAGRPCRSSGAKDSSRATA